MSVTNSLPGPDSHFISLSTAESMTTTYRAQRENILDSNYKNQNILPLSETFNRNALDVLLSTENCAGIRIYYGMEESLKVHSIMVAVTEENEDILPVAAEGLASTTATLVEIGQRCPDICPPSSPLNH